jgi:hypothetical protein
MFAACAQHSGAIGMCIGTHICPPYAPKLVAQIGQLLPQSLSYLGTVMASFGRAASPFTPQRTLANNPSRYLDMRACASQGRRS